MKLSQEAYNKHQLWLQGDEDGERLNSVDLNFTGDWAHANLSKATLTGANFGGVSLLRANLSGCDLVGANLKGCNLQWSDLTDADLTGADLTNANISRANLTNACVDGAGLWGVVLIGAVLPDEYDLQLYKCLHLRDYAKKNKK